uniref:FBA domain-containing protein n=2 Tax=Terrapene triunguis TaxID=2587831 RepID=A0A674JXK0_9SAUR
MGGGGGVMGGGEVSRGGHHKGVFLLPSNTPQYLFLSLFIFENHINPLLPWEWVPTKVSSPVPSNQLPLHLAPSSPLTHLHPTDQFCHWQVERGGDGWKVEENGFPVDDTPAQTCFTTSFHWCVKSQLVDLLKEGLWEELLDTYQPEIYISDWWGAQEDCGCKYSICVRLLGANKRTVIAEFQANSDAIQQWNDAQYHQVSYRFRQYGRGVRYVHFLHRGKETRFRPGHYGARITNSTVMVKLS